MRERGLVRECARIVVKVGSSLLTEGASGKLRWDWLRSLAMDVARLKQGGCEVLIVSSGAIALGRGHLGIRRSSLKLEEKQASAAVGQILLANGYKEVFGACQLTVAQLLLTLGDTEQRRQYLNARNTMETLLHLDAIPLINENDTVTTEEIRFGDNDRLAASRSAKSSLYAGLQKDISGGSPDKQFDPNSASSKSSKKEKNKLLDIRGEKKSHKVKECVAEDAVSFFANPRCGESIIQQDEVIQLNNSFLSISYNDK